MRTVLSVAEKPSVAKELASIISRQPPDSIKRSGISPYNPVFDVGNCMFMNAQARMIITSVTGHLMEIEFDAAFKGWSSCQPVELFTAPVHKTVKKEGENIQKTLIREARQSNILLLWLDCDLEGENIAYEVIKVCCEANPRLDVYRARFSALVERDISRTLKFPDRPNAHMNDAVDARQEIDLRIGAAFTRFQTLRLQRKFENVGNSVISFGPCQFPTLGFVVERSAKIKAFRPESFWSISCSHEFDNPDKPGAKLNCSFNWERGRVYDQFTCTVLYETCVEGGGGAVVTQCNERPTSRLRPIPMNTIDFQMRASRLLRMTSEHAMGVAEALYQRGILSYPRTETNFFQTGIDLLGIVGDHRNHPDWGGYASMLLDNANNIANNNANAAGGGVPVSSNKFLWPRVGGKDDQAHPPIHPTKSVNLQELQSDDERKVYDLVSRHFLACCSCDARGSLSSITIGIPNAQGEKFHASGLMVLERNWLDIYSQYEQWHANKVPTVKVGDPIAVRTLMMTEGRTCPPSPISESELIATMDRNGIGTDATIATHISTIQAREYAVRNAQNLFEPTKLGLALVEGYNSMGYQLNKPQLRALIEADCQRIAKGELRREDMVRKCLEGMKQCFLVCSREAAKLDASMEKYFSVLGAGPAGVYHVLSARLSVCGTCHNLMDLRSSDGDHSTESRRYLFCGTCVKAHPMPRGDLQPHAQHCTICGFQALTVRNTDTNKEHNICPRCFSDTPEPPVGIEGGSEFRCFSCAKSDCPLAMRQAGSEVDISPCSAPRCSGFLRMKKNQKGYLLSCTVVSCKSVWWVPKFVRSAQPLDKDLCTRCAHLKNSPVHKILFRFILDKAPPGTPPECSLCPSCDPLWQAIGYSSLTVPMRKQSHPPFLTSSSTSTSTATSAIGNSVANASLGFNSYSSSEGRKVSDASGSAAVSGVVVTSGSDYQAALAGKRSRKPPVSSAAACTAPPSRGNSRATTTIGQEPTELAQVMCNCAIPVPCKVVTVVKEGANKGRPFYACSKTRGEACTAFHWADEPVRQQSGAGGRQQTSTSLVASSDGSKLCKCKLPASYVLTRKEGPNMGRYFYACSKPRDDATRCDHFDWATL